MRSTPRRTLRTLTALTGAVVLALSLSPATTPATAVTESTVVGSPEQFLIENVHAARKVLEIGNENAQKTGPGGAWTAAAAIFTRAAQPADIRAQAVTAYPVLGRDRTFVFTNDEGEVLARNANDSEHYRYLTLADVSIDDAAVDPYAQWTVVDAGGGAVYLQNVQRDRNGRTAALDMYNWATADGAEIQTYDAGTAAVQKWYLRSLTPEVAAFSGRTDRGVAPELPASRTARYSWGPSVELKPLTWDAPDASVWDVDGTVTITGTGTGFFGEDVTVTAEYLVGSVGDAVDAAMTTNVGTTVKQLRMHAPTRVERTVSGSETTVTAPVSWDWSGITDESLQQEGTLTIDAAAGTGFAARLVVTVVATETTNIVRGAGVHFGKKFGEGSGLSDGNRDAVGFSDWRSGGATNRVNPNTVMFYFDEPRQVTGASLFDRGGDSKRNIGQVTIQYRDLRGGWVDLPVADLTWPYTNPTAELALEVQSSPVLATGMRAVVSNKSNDTWMSLSEFEVYGPASANAR
ncbi:RICIN domain-containing protein [Agromyces atrinae]|uniref:Bacterial Ig-like domain-containing protein n=1 Tax=Agromyces atrinae TaxID=592376 RepID=A0A4Q2M2U4_9MICO|nr:Ig-like domain-containing protein [Agromyces atrinae]NYD68731.1 hypothetical protein [Agromyces atrinae]RXZ86088.1 hypothetical protein ESP50_12900 [Agromyces atrinae]